MTLTQTFAWRRSGVVSTSVMVTNPTRGSATSRLMIAPISCLRSSSTLSVLWLTAGLVGRRPTDGLRGEALDHVAFHDVVEVGESDSAFVVLGHFADIVAEPAERLDPVRRDDLATAPDTGVAAADDASVSDERARDDRVLADADDLSDLGASLDDLDDLGFEKPLEGGPDVVRQLVDDVVQADVDALGLGGTPRGVGDLRVEAHDDGIRRSSEHDVVVGDVAGAFEQDVETDLLLVELLEGVGDGTQRPGHVRLQDDPELLGLTRLDLAVQVLEGGAATPLAALGGGRGLAGLDHRPGFLLVTDDAQDVSGHRDVRQPEDHHGARRTSLGDALAHVVLERPDAAERLADDDDVADLERAGLDERRGDRAATLVELGFDDGADRVPLRVRLQLLEIRDEQDHLDQLVETDPRLGRDGNERHVAAVLLDHDAGFGQLGLHAVGVGVRLVDLVHRDDDRDLGRLRVADRLERLGHDAVVCSDDDYRDVGHLCTAGAHGGERPMARCV